MCYVPPFCKVKLFDLLQQTIVKNEKLMVWYSMLVNGATLHNLWGSISNVYSHIRLVIENSNHQLTPFNLHAKFQ
jgi:hypothetical protein